MALMQNLLPKPNGKFSIRPEGDPLVTPPQALGTPPSVGPIAPPWTPGTPPQIINQPPMPLGPPGGGLPGLPPPLGIIAPPWQPGTPPQVHPPPPTPLPVPGGGPTLPPPQPIITGDPRLNPRVTQPGIGQGFLANANGEDIRGLWTLLDSTYRGGGFARAAGGGLGSTGGDPGGGLPGPGTWTPPGGHGLSGSQPNLGPLPGTALASQQGTALATGFGQQTPTSPRGNNLPTLRSAGDLRDLMPKKAAGGSSIRWTY